MSPPTPPRPSGEPPGVSESSLRTVRLTSEVDVRSFRCGVEALDAFLRRHAAGNDALGASRTFVLLRRATDPPELPPLLGYYSLAQGVIDSALAQRHFPDSKLPRYPLGVALLARLAIDSRCQRMGLGALLLIDALTRSVLAANHLAGVGVIVDAKDEPLVNFYGRFGFVLLSEPGAHWPRRLFLRASDIHAVLDPRSPSHP